MKGQGNLGGEARTRVGFGVGTLSAINSAIKSVVNHGA